MANVNYSKMNKKKCYQGDTIPFEIWSLETRIDQLYKLKGKTRTKRTYIRTKD